MLFRETDTYPTQESNIDSLEANSGTNINKVIRPILISSYNVDLNTQWEVPNCVAPCDYLGVRGSQQNLYAGYSEDFSTITIYRGICIIHEVTLEFYQNNSININQSQYFFDTRPGDAGSYTFWAAAKLVIDTEAADFNDGKAQMGMFGDIANYVADPDDYVLLAGFVLTLDAEGYVSDISEIIYWDPANPDWGRRNLEIVDDGWIPRIPDRFIGLS